MTTERPDLTSTRRIGVLRLDNAGDVVLAGPVFRALRAHVPSTTLVLVASPGGAAVSALLPWVDEVAVWRSVWQDVGGAMPFEPRREHAAIDRLGLLDLDAVFILTSFDQTPYAAGYACYLAGIAIRVGHAQGFAGGVLSHAIPGPAPVHQAERNLHLLEGIGVAVNDDRLEARIPMDTGVVVRGVLAEHGVRDREAIVVAPGASASARRYAPASLAAALAHIRRSTGRPVVIVGTPTESELAAPIVAAVPEALDLVGRTSVIEAAAVIASAGVVVANNSLAMHLADAFGRPVVVAFAGTETEAEWRPRRTAHVLLREPTPCAPCRLFDCPIEGHPCLDLDPTTVGQAAVDLLAAQEADPGGVGAHALTLGP